jgi:hypothetical protein
MLFFFFIYLFFFFNGIELMEHLSPGASFEVLTVVVMKISIRDMT